MPNHLHGIIILKYPDNGSRHGVSLVVLCIFKCVSALQRNSQTVFIVKPHLAIITPGGCPCCTKAGYPSGINNPAGKCVETNYLSSPA